MRIAIRLTGVTILTLLFIGRVNADESTTKIRVTTRDVYGATVEAEMPVTVFRPSQGERLSAVVLSHGRPSLAQRQSAGRVKLSSVSTTLLGMGLVVVVPTRIGYGVAGGPDLEFTVSCDQPRYAEALSAVADQIVATVAYARTLPYVDPDRVFLVGHSVGGAGTIAATARKIPGVRAAVAFNSGHGGRPQQRPGEPCAPEALKSAFTQYGATHSSVPVLWVHTDGDRSFSLVRARDWFNAFSAAGGRGTFLAFSTFLDDSHEWFSKQPAQWREPIQAFLAENGMAP